ncbi:MAG: hypothetical protein ABI633_00645 [Burkholderiales bacterium]
MHSADRAAIANRGPRHPRRQRGMLTRPAIAEMHAYRTAVDATVADFIHESPAQEFARAAPLIEHRVFSRLRLARDV